MINPINKSEYIDGRKSAIMTKPRRDESVVEQQEKGTRGKP